MKTPRNSTRNGFLPGWYYQRQAKWISGDDARDGMGHVELTNKDAGRIAHMIQGVGIDGSAIKEIEISAWIKHDEVVAGNRRTDLPRIAIMFFDKSRRNLGVGSIGPFYGTAKWHRQSKRIRVPGEAMEAIVSISMFGATGSISFDEVELRKIGR